jgi:hypothetical protein
MTWKLLLMTRKLLAGAALVTGVLASDLGSLACRLANADLPQQPLRGTLVLTADMQVSRAAHTATALPDGRVLVVGGFGADGEASIAGAELYDPSVDGFMPLPPMIARRHSHSATLLPNGKVLIAGGYGEGGTTLASAELFDPATGSFAPTGPLNAARTSHMAVRLLDGRVLIAGGVGPNWTFLSSAEIYDPATGSFSWTGSLSAALIARASVRLADGRVLILGGHRGRGSHITVVASAEIYDPTRGVFTPAGEMLTPRHKHDAVLLPDGTVLITGGSDERDDRGMYNSSELYDPRTATFRAGPRMRLARHKHTGTSVVLPSGLVLIAGGAPVPEVYDPRARNFALVGGNLWLPGLFSSVASLRDGRVLITGGYGNGGGPRPSAWLYRP